MSSNDQIKSELNVISLMNDPPDTQAEKIADNFARVSQEYEPLQKEDIDINLAKNIKPVPWITQDKICQTIRKMKSKTSTVINDIPWKLIKAFSLYLSNQSQNHIHLPMRTNGVFKELFKNISFMFENISQHIDIILKKSCATMF